jgi:hypothetical protein
MIFRWKRKEKIGRRRILCGALDFFMDKGHMGYIKKNWLIYQGKKEKRKKPQLSYSRAALF